MSQEEGGSWAATAAVVGGSVLGGAALAGAAYYAFNKLYDPEVDKQHLVPPDVLALFARHAWRGSVDRASFKKVLREPVVRTTSKLVRQLVRNAVSFSPERDQLSMSLNLAESQVIKENPWVEEYLQEVEAALQGLHVEVPDHFVDACLRFFDGDGDGTISKQEFVSTYVRLTQGTPGARIGAVFSLLDEDNSYGVELGELQRAADDLASLVHSLASEVLEDVATVASRVLMHHIVREVAVLSNADMFEAEMAPITLMVEARGQLHIHPKSIPSITREIPRDGLYQLILSVTSALPRDSICEFMCKFVRDEVILEQQFALLAGSVEGKVNCAQFEELMRSWVDFGCLASAFIPAHIALLDEHMRIHFPVQRTCELLFRVLDANMDGMLSWHEVSFLMELYEPTAPAFVGDDLTKSYSGNALAAVNKSSGLELTNRFMEVVAGRQAFGETLEPAPVANFFNALFELVATCVKFPFESGTDSLMRRTVLPRLVEAWFKANTAPGATEMTVEDFSIAAGVTLLNAMDELMQE